ncbi:hypothetical protein P0082_10130 [Candidatus Haliotispira prima]|uniref:Uncharacterized protein n=1 Tax=Candidatus Haliotispira prima TaxID=3034016 RepID=A0ABY8MG45_9SPIO|nr:hypothetical protein P0082_10130 [Candidatus Haliotispira prima]
MEKSRQEDWDLVYKLIRKLIRELIGNLGRERRAILGRKHRPDFDASPVVGTPLSAGMPAAEEPVREACEETFEEPFAEPWQKHWQRKQESQRSLRRNYVQLILFTLLFGILTIGLRLGLRSGSISILRLRRFSENVLQYWSSGPGQTDQGSEESQGPQGRRTEKESRNGFEAALADKQPSAGQLEALIGRELRPEQLCCWGPGREQAGSNEELELLYFAEAGVYLLRGRSDRRVAYAGRQRP